ncbi:peptidylprolyl isomerase [Psychrobacillus soli]|uniref:peptidylprolyl isomerase n=1 Tax=Psychrobacillus soli TaxID=1543965 RepID=A0A544TG31_9BACI|nr:peptidylprolyl isomerase [Psychrobacillus soli]TQR16435.1 foldase [Psychrobacillus soli]
MKNKTTLWLLTGIILIAAIILLIILVIGNKTYVASVNGQKITEDTLNEKMMDNYGEETVESLIMEEIIRQETEKEGILISQEEIDAEMQVYQENYGGEEAFQEVLETSGVELSDVEEDIRTYLALNQLFKNRITITEEEIETYFEENKDSFTRPKQVEAIHILVEDEKTAGMVAEKLKAGEDFSTLAKEYSIDETTKDTGGELSYFSVGEMEQAFEDAAFSMDIDEVSQPVETSYGYHIIKVTDKIDEKEANLTDVKEEIEQAISDSKIDAEYELWLEEKYETYDIQYLKEV